MQLFYHVTRDIELPRAGRRSQPSRTDRGCEACGRPLPPGIEESEGGTPALSFCADCRERLDRSAIQIHFCDQCGVSVPLENVQSGTALARDGRILCPKCHRPGAIGGSRVVLWFLVAVGAAVIAGVALALASQ